jgi:GxxExxY protein
MSTTASARVCKKQTYENALCVQLRHQGIQYTQQARYAVQYRHEVVDEFVPDLMLAEQPLE